MTKKRERPKKYQEKLSLTHLTFEQAIDKVLAYKPARKKTKRSRHKKEPT